MCALQSGVSSLAGGPQDHFSLDEPGSVTDDSEHFIIHETQFTGCKAVDFKGGILLDNQSSTTVIDAMSPLMWTKLFLQKQGCNPTVKLEQDNTSAILLERHGKASSGKRTRHLNKHQVLLHH